MTNSFTETVKPSSGSQSQNARYLLLGAVSRQQTDGRTARIWRHNGHCAWKGTFPRVAVMPIDIKVQ
jgi:hypothetical protein